MGGYGDRYSGGPLTTPVLLPDGTEALPGLAFAADPNTGLRRPGDDILGFVTGGADRWQIDADGHFIAADDDTYDIGADAANRPRSIFIGSDGQFGGDVTVIAAVSVGTTLTVGGNADIEGVAAIGNGSAPNSALTLIVDRDISGTAGARQVFVTGNIVATGGVNTLAFVEVGPSGIAIESGGVHGNVGTMILAEPRITETDGTVTNAFTLKVNNAPTEGDNNYALWMPSGSFGVSNGDGAAGEQLTSGGAGGDVTWAAAASQAAAKYISAELPDADAALARILSAPVQSFRYRRETVDGKRIGTTGDYDTLYKGVMAEDAPEVMHHEGRIFSPVSAHGEVRLAIQALERQIRELKEAARA